MVTFKDIDGISLDHRILMPVRYLETHRMLPNGAEPVFYFTQVIEFRVPAAICVYIPLITEIQYLGFPVVRPDTMDEVFSPKISKRIPKGQFYFGQRIHRENLYGAGCVHIQTPFIRYP